MCIVEETSSLPDGWISRLSLREKFNMIGQLICEIKERVPKFAEDTSYRIEPNSQAHIAVSKEVVLLADISATINHTPQYLSFLNKSRIATVELIASDEILLECLALADELNVVDRRSIMQEVHNLHTQASQEVINRDFHYTSMDFESSDLGFFNKPEQYSAVTGERFTSIGLFFGYIKSGDRWLKFNEHEDAGLQDIFKGLSVVHHETIHDQVFQLGHAIALDEDRKTGELYKDGLMLYLQQIERAIVPSGIYDVYRYQCFEEVAYQQQDLFEKEVRALVNA